MLRSLWQLRILGILLLGSPAGAGAQARYTPSGENPAGRELVAVYVSSTWCIGNRAEGLHEAVEGAKLILRDQATAWQMGFRAVGVALDWHPDSGKVYLDEFGAWDEIAVGSNWFGLAPEALIWADTAAAPRIPQVIVYEHEVRPGEQGVVFGERRVLRRVYGGDAIVEWVRQGAVVER